MSARTFCREVFNAAPSISQPQPAPLTALNFLLQPNLDQRLIRHVPSIRGRLDRIEQVPCKAQQCCPQFQVMTEPVPELRPVNGTRLWGPPITESVRSAHTGTPAHRDCTLMKSGTFGDVAEFTGRGDHLCFATYPLVLGLSAIEHMRLYFATKQKILYFAPAD